MLDVLEEAVSPETLRDILPVTYTALLNPDQVIRRGGIDLWAACACQDARQGRFVESLPQGPCWPQPLRSVHSRMCSAWNFSPHILRSAAVSPPGTRFPGRSTCRN